MTQAYISIGSNIEAKKNIAKVKKKLNQLFICTFSDNFYTEAEGFEGQDFINLVAGFETSLDAVKLTQTLKTLEKKMGRESNQKGMHDRVIDLDLILLGDLIAQDQGINLPSNDIENYLFVLEPLAQIAKEHLHPVFNISFEEMLKEKLR
ncbi:MAG TPA: 2-amino-4-hydroxy-6-hydroxymethyldihydropteridine diphosphokinase [Gammaproteobacteria bacterium]|jgi:2-amino-4-hydroxy-6-hydroxymethyldihydropteridine diphosphokinase|nr:2-amino-4-hydroxy-6-hydroxymethyldihydropteridine diphosphokinase [Gammaproteobacteria bacterium]HIN73752.1 2-amino-4-hydroxy-6-hydroxymethyldihydropteridine diphosphokinase [Gammaproteobacteria bacterium]HIO05034.1 2-amino-4-hydroxy-6-hydroxymethyldihydropteridine diphosphokinase [Gammaproteobacteria bacterium]HIO42811.1 2-amino-4-hydroxy-6-hydroxymethyldihydropteridine diphosphokinase [Gammaproteobacteria bacterium]